MHIMLGIQRYTFTNTKIRQIIGQHFLQAHGSKDLLKECQIKGLKKVPLGQIWLLSLQNAPH